MESGCVHVDSKIRLGCELDVMTYLSQINSNLESVKISDPIWVATLQCGTVLSFGPSTPINPTEFN